MQTEYDDELKNAPSLRGMKGKNSFTVPDGYFDSLSSRIQDKINAPQPKTVWEKLLMPLQRPVFAYATITIAVVSYAVVYFSQTPVVTKQIAETSITADDIYDSNIITDYDETLLAEALIITSDEKHSETSAQQDVDDYLMDNNTDELELINAF